MKRKLKVICGIVIVIVLAVNTYRLIANYKKISILEKESAAIVIPKKEQLKNIANPAEVLEIENKFKETVNSFLKDEYLDDTNNSGYMVLRNLFVVIGSSGIILNKNSTHEERVEYYKPFSYKLSNFAMRYNGDEKIVIMNIDLYYDEENQNRPMNLVEFTLDTDNRIKAGELYGTTK